MHQRPVPTLEQLRGLQPDEIGRLILPFIALQLQRNSHGFVPRDLARNLSSDSGHRAVDNRDEYAELVIEGIGFLDRAGFLIDAPEQVLGHFFRFSRAGLRAARNPESASFTTVSGQEARTLLHPEIARAALGDFERGEYDKAVYSAFRTLEIAVRDRSGVTATAKDTFYDAFALKGADRGRLIPADMENGEANSLREVFAGAYGAFRNPSAHRDVQDDPAQAMRLLLTASALFHVLEELPSIGTD